ncbi:hypothetical protein GQ53DRAFT_886288 [Thozetella sp. PMI_491]|nr:hypothetical protein GQ53DRAFT_886288 [Thozetella sp. PMI_491]
MEWVGIAFNLASAVETLSGHLIKGYNETANFGQSLEKIRLALSLESTSFKALKTILFGKLDEPVAGSGLFADFDLQTQLDIINVLRQFRESLDGQYQLVTKRYQPSALSVSSVVESSVPFGSNHSATIFQRLRWGFADKSKVEKVVRELQCWNERLLRIVQSKMIQNEREMSALNKAPSTLLYKLQATDLVGEADSLGLSDDLQLVKISTQPPSHVPDALRLLDFGIYEDAKTVLQSDRRRLVLANGQNFLLEYKEFNPDQNGEPSQASIDRVIQLSAILRQTKASRYHTLSCQNYYCYKGRFALVFNIPAGLDPHYRTLHWLLKQSRVPSLEDRFVLARKLCSSLSAFQSVEWVHKSFRSDNILFFSRLHDSPMDYAFETPYLSGWEYSRPESGLSSLRADPDDIGENVYRHPDQWGLPTVRFNRSHDIYSLGVVLLEIGRWKQALSFHHNHFRGCEFGDAVQNCLLSAARDQKLRSSMGRRYQRIVLQCLEGSFDQDTGPSLEIAQEMGNGGGGEANFPTEARQDIRIYESMSTSR